MSLTLHWYEPNDAYIVEKNGDRCKIDFETAEPYHRNWVDLRYGLENLLARLFVNDDEYGTLLHLKDAVIKKMGLRANDLDIIKYYCNAENFTTVFTAGPVYESLEKVKQHVGWMKENNWVDEPQYIEKLDAAMSFIKEAKEKNGLLHMRHQ